MSGIFDTGIFDFGIFDSAVGTFDTGIFDRNIYDNILGPVAVNPSETITGGGSWREFSKQRYRVYPEYDPEAKPRRKKKRVVIDGQIVLEPDPVIETGIVPVRPAWGAMVELQQQIDEANRARLKRLRAIALADDEWLMVA